jgi:hypothetical protein
MGGKIHAFTNELSHPQLHDAGLDSLTHVNHAKVECGICHLQHLHACTCNGPEDLIVPDD